MVLLLAGATHTGKTLLAQRLLEKYHWPYLSLDHLKMGLIRSGNTSLTPADDEALTAYLWPIVRELVKTAVENGQNLIVEGCYIPFDWRESFPPSYLEHIQYRCLIMTEGYIRSHFADIRAFAGVVERRLDDADLSQGALIAENAVNLRLCREHECGYILIDGTYDVDLDL